MPGSTEIGGASITVTYDLSNAVAGAQAKLTADAQKLGAAFGKAFSVAASAAMNVNASSRPGFGGGPGGAIVPYVGGGASAGGGAAGRATATAQEIRITHSGQMAIMTQHAQVMSTGPAVFHIASANIVAGGGGPGAGPAGGEGGSGGGGDGGTGGGAGG